MASPDIDALVARGLDRYRAGDIDGALLAWEAALAVDPEEPRALGYVDYVRQNYDELAGAGPSPMAELLIPFGLARSDDDGDDDYEISITAGDVDDDVTGTRHRVDPPSAPEPSVDDGWGLDAESEPTWFTGPARQALDLATAAHAELELGPPGGAWLELEGEPTQGEAAAAVASLRAASEGGFGDDDHTRDFRQAPALDGAEQSGEATAERGRVDFGPDFTGERTTERVAARLAPEVLRGLGIAPLDERRAGSEDLTTEAWPHAGFELAGPGGGALELPDPLAGRLTGPPTGPETGPLTGPLTGSRPPEEPLIEPLAPVERFDDQGTADLKGKVRALAGDEGRAGRARQDDEAGDDDRRPVAFEELILPSPGQSTSPIDDDGPAAPPGRSFTADEALTLQVSAEIDAGAPAREAVEDRVRRRIPALLARAQAAAAAGEHPVAVAAIDLALTEAPDVAAAQKLVHRSRDLILECYFRYFGDLQRMPSLAAPLSELTRRPLDPRAAFLLSRIDGTLTFEEILDVAGMGRLEACRHLAHLLWRGIIRA